MTVNICTVVLYLPRDDAGILTPWSPAIERRPLIASSRPMMITTIHAGARPSSTNDMNAAEINSLSATGSSSCPSGVT